MLLLGPTMSWYCYPTIGNNDNCFDVNVIKNEPFYWSKEYTNNFSYANVNLEEDAYTPQLELYTMVFQTFVFMQIFN